MSRWSNNDIQFLRLLAEISATIDINNREWNLLCKSMDITSEELAELFTRAQERWEIIKQETIEGFHEEE